MINWLFTKVFKRHAIAIVKPRYVRDLIERKYMKKKGLIKSGTNCTFRFINCSTTKFYIDGNIIQCLNEIEHLKSIKNPRMSVIKLPFSIMVFKVESHIPIYQFGI